MINRTLLVGCSYLDVGMRHPIPPWDKINYRKYLFKEMVAAGNKAIAAKVKYEISQSNYEHLIVLWSGINRIDVPVSATAFGSLPNTYKFINPIGDQVWYLSGGICGSWQQGDDCPDYVKSIFREEFLHQTQRSASDDTLKAIVDTQEFLEQHGQSYTMSFIYDIHADYNDKLDITGNKFPRATAVDRWPEWLALEHCLGKIDTQSEWYDRVNWEKFPANQTPYEYCSERNMLEPDKFHPTKDGLKQWFQTQLDIYLTDS